MPLRAATGVLAPEQPGPELEPLPPTTPPDAPYVTWTPAGGTERILSQPMREGWMLGGVGGPRSIVGLDLPPQEEFDTPLAGGGELANGRRWGARPFAVPIVVHADTLEQLEVHRRDLMSSFNPARGDGTFTVAYPNGLRRHLTAGYSSGLEDPEQGRMGGGLYFDSYTVRLKARDPFSYGDEEIVSFNLGAGGSFYPIPFTISPSTTTGDSTISIDGEVEVWPEWTLRGPMTTATLKNRDTGKTLTLTPNLSAGQKVTVRTDPRTPPARRFTNLTGASVWGSVAGQFPVIWSLQPGDNRVTILAAGTSTSSRVELRYRPRYLSA